MAGILYRAFAEDLELREDGRLVCGICVPWDSPAEIREARRSYTEVFKRGAFAQTIAQRGDKVKFLVQHNRQTLPIGKAMNLREDGAGLYGEFRVSQTQAGDDALTLIRDGAVDALSIGFTPVADNWSKTRDYVERTEAKLHEVSATGFPAYEGASIVGVRADGTPLQRLPREVAERRLRLMKLESERR